MKIPRENIKSTGLSVVYEPDNRTDINLEYGVLLPCSAHSLD